MHMHCIGHTLIVVLSMKMNETINGRVDAVFRATQLDERHVVILSRGQPSRCADRNLANNETATTIATVSIRRTREKCKLTHTITQSC